MTSSADTHGFRNCVTQDLRRFRMIATGRSGDTLRPLDWLSIASPRFLPMLLQRIAYKLQTCRLGPLAKLVSLLNFCFFGIEIATRCPIAGGLFFPHTQGTVIGAIGIGANVTIYQGVTIGAKELDFAYLPSNRPAIGDNVMIGSGAKVLGGVTIGNGVRIGANTVVLSSLAANVTAVGASMRVIESPRDES